MQSVQTQTVMTYGADYALGWCAFACLSYATIIYLARDHTCNVLGEPVLDPYLGGTSDDYKDLEPGKKADQGPMDDVFGPPAAGLYGNPALVGQAYGPTYGTYGPAGGASIAPYYGPTSIGLKPAQQYQYGQVHTHAHTLSLSENRVSVNLNHKVCEKISNVCTQVAGGHVRGPSAAGTSRTLPSQLGRPAGGSVEVYSTNAQPIGFQVGGGAGPSGLNLSGNAGFY